VTLILAAIVWMMFADRMERGGHNERAAGHPGAATGYVVMETIARFVAIVLMSMGTAS
jgi:hypothetical protein